MPREATAGTTLTIQGSLDAERGRIAHLQRGLRTADPGWAPEWD
jgi:hypothetical protein